MKVGVVVFPGSNCDRDALHVVREVLGEQAVALWHKDRDLQGADALVIPGGFSFGDYLRTGAVARFSPIMDEVAAFIERGGPVLGICNGFQILLEAGVLPGAMLPNRSLRFICRDVHVLPQPRGGRFVAGLDPARPLRLPIAHYEGNWFADDETFARVEGEGLVALRYCDELGNVTDEANPNGSRGSVAGLTNARRNVLGLMPHPERVCESILGGTDGLAIFKSLL